MKNIRNEGLIERIIQATVSVGLFLGAFFWTSGNWQIFLFAFSLVVAIFVVIGFCPLYAIFGKRIEKPKKGLSRKDLVILVLWFVMLFLIGSYASNFFSKKFFIQDFNAMNKYYKQVLFETGQEKRTEAIENYDKLVDAYEIFENKYFVYHPYALREDKKFTVDLKNIEQIIVSLKDGVYVGNLKEVHLELEKIRPITQDIFKRNNFSMLAIALVDFHDSMEKVIEVADMKNSAGVIDAYIEADNKLKAVEVEANDQEIQLIRKNLDELLELANKGKVENLPAKAAELKSSFVKVYLIRG